MTGALPADAAEWARSLLEFSGNIQTTTLSGGANNIVARCDGGDRSVVIKAYPQAGAAAETRFKTEHAFLAYANVVAPQYVPRVIGADATRRMLALETLHGPGFGEVNPASATDVAAAVAFISLLNASGAPGIAAIAPAAADGFLELSDHINDVNRRVSELSFEHLTAQDQPAAIAMIKNVRTAASKITVRLEGAINCGRVTNRLPAEYVCLSPSDFGFHNAIRTPDGPKFFDFEFAGWDDPAKCFCDFFLQPRVPVPASFAPSFESALGKVIPRAQLRERAAELRPLLSVKWVTIVLSVLRPARLADILNLRGADAREPLIAERMATAHRLLSQMDDHGIH